MGLLNYIQQVAPNPAGGANFVGNSIVNLPAGVGSAGSSPTIQPLNLPPLTKPTYNYTDYLKDKNGSLDDIYNVQNVLNPNKVGGKNFYIPGVTQALPDGGSSKNVNLSGIGAGVGNALGAATGNAALGSGVGKVLNSGLGKVSDTMSHIISTKGVKALGEKGALKAMGSSFKTGVSDLFKSGAGWGMAADIASSFLPTKSEYSGDKGGVTQGMDKAYDSISDAIAMVPGWGTAASAIMKGAAFVGKGIGALGGGTDGMTTADAILGSSFFNWTPMGMINGFGGKRAMTIKKDNEAFEEVGGSYSGTNTTVDNAVSKSGKKYGLISGSARRKANELIQKATFQQNKVSDIADAAVNSREAAMYMGDMSQNRAALNLMGGYDQKSVRVGKTGMKLITNEHKNKAKNTLAKIKKIKEEVRAEEVAQFAEGGKMNVIPEGALHARLHHMDVEGITKKGIPVVIEEAGGEIVQQAEIERNEIIFTKEVTDKLEALYKKGTDEAAIEAGKLLAHEIIENTIDNTGLIDEVV